MSKADSPTKLCQPHLDLGERRAMRARVDGVPMCSSHYNRARYAPEDRHRKVTVPCAWCSEPCDKGPGRANRYANLFCSLACRDAWRLRQSQMRKLPVIFVGEVRRPQPAPRTIEPAPKARTWVAGNCAWCGGTFVDRQPEARFCSPICGRRYWRKRYKEQDGVTNAVRQHVYARDKWRCQICRRAIRRNAEVPHPLAATVDHVVPRSHGGSHDPANLRAAHFICNAQRGNRGGGEQLLLVG